MSTATMHNRYFADALVSVQVVPFKRTGVTDLLVTVPALLVQSPTGEQIDTPELQAMISESAERLSIMLSPATTQALKALDFDVRHFTATALSFAIGELQHADSDADMLTTDIDCEIESEIMFLSDRDMISADYMS